MGDDIEVVISSESDTNAKTTDGPYNDEYRFTINDPEGNPHNGKTCTRMEISPGCKYLVTYSEDDHSLVGWDVESKSINEGNEGRLKPDIFISNSKVDQMCVSDNRKLACVYKKELRM